jgi:hypothetical protein
VGNPLCREKTPTFVVRLLHQGLAEAFPRITHATMLHNARSVTSWFVRVPGNAGRTWRSSFEIVERSCLHIGQGRQAGVLEVLYWRVPQVVIPATPHQYRLGRTFIEFCVTGLFDDGTY